MGRLTDNLKFNVGSNIQYAQQQGIAGPTDAPDQGLARATKAIQQFVGIMPKLAEQELKEGRRTAEKGKQAGYQGVDIDASGTEFADSFRQQNEKLAKDLRDRGEITLVDDPYFQEGYQIAKGEMETLRFQNETKAWYDNVKNNPNLYKDRRAFEEALQLRFDLAFSQLPRNQYIQAGFMKNMAPFVENVKSQYKVDLNNHHRKEYLISQKGKTSGSVINFREEQKLIQNFSDEEVVSFLQSMPEQLWYDDLPMDMEEMTPEYARAKLNEMAYQDLIDDLNEVGRDLHQFQGDNEFGLGVNPTEARLQFLVESMKDEPYLLDRVIRELGSGTGKLADTARGKAVLGEIFTASAEKKKEDYIESVINESADLGADITYIDVFSQRNGQTVSDSQAQLETRIDEMFPVGEYPEQNSRYKAKLANSVIAQERVSDADKLRATIEQSVGQLAGIDSNTAVRTLDALANENKAHTDRSLKNTLGAAGVQYLQDGSNEEEFWNLVETTSKYNTQRSSNVRVANAYGSPSVVANSPRMLNTLLEAERRGVLDVFTSDDTEVYQAIQNISGGVTGDPERDLKTFEAEVKEIRQKEKVSELEKRVDFKLSKIPIQSGSKIKEIAHTELVRELVSGSNELSFIPEELSVAAATKYMEAYQKAALNNSHEKAVERATQHIKENLSVIDVGVTQKHLFGDDKLYILSDASDSDDLYIMMQEFAKNDDGRLQAGIEQLYEVLQKKTNLPATLDEFKEQYTNVARGMAKDRIPERAEEARARRMDELMRADYEQTKTPFAKYILGPFTQQVVSRLAPEDRAEITKRLLEAGETFQAPYDAGVALAWRDYMRQTIEEYTGPLGPEFEAAVNKADTIGYFSVLSKSWIAEEHERLEKSIDNTPDNLFSMGFEDSSEMMEYRRATDLQLDENFDFDSDITMYQVREGHYGFMDADGNVLNYSNPAYGQYLMTPQEVQYHMDAVKFESSEYLWPRVGQKIAPDFKGTPNNKEFDELMLKWMERFPTQPSTKTFRQVFGDQAFVMEKRYKKLKGRK